MNSLLAMFLVGGVIVELVGLVPWQKLLTYALIPVVVITANVIRLMSVVLFGEFIGSKFALDHAVHGSSDAIVYLAALALIWGWSHVVRRVGMREERSETACWWMLRRLRAQSLYSERLGASSTTRTAHRRCHACGLLGQ